MKQIPSSVQTHVTFSVGKPEIIKTFESNFNGGVNMSIEEVFNLPAPITTIESAVRSALKDMFPSNS